MGVPSYLPTADGSLWCFHCRLESRFHSAFNCGQSSKAIVWSSATMNKRPCLKLKPVLRVRSTVDEWTAPERYASRQVGSKPARYACRNYGNPDKRAWQQPAQT